MFMVSIAQWPRLIAMITAHIIMPKRIGNQTGHVHIKKMTIASRNIIFSYSKDATSATTNSVAIPPNRMSAVNPMAAPRASLTLQPVNPPTRIVMSPNITNSSIIVTVPHYDIATGSGRTQHPRVQQVRSVNPLYNLHHQVGGSSHQCNRQCSHISLSSLSLEVLY